MTKGHESKICNSSPIRTAGEGGLLCMKCTCEAWNGCPRSIRASSGSSATPVRRPGFDVQPPGPDYAACLRLTNTAHEARYHVDSLTRDTTRFLRH